MSSQPSDRHTWAVEMMDVQPSDHVLEIGCGHGIAVSLICRQLVTGTITALDRSQAMVNAAQKRNQKCIQSGRAVIYCANLDTADLGARTFDKIFAINVSLFFSQDSAHTLEIVRQHLSPRGILTLVHQPPTPSQTPDIADKLSECLPRNGFTSTSVVLKDIPPAPAVCVQAHA